MVFLHDFSMSSQNVQYGKNVTLSFYIIAICITGQQVNLLRCTTKYRAKRHYTSIVVAKYKWSLLCEDVDFSKQFT